MTEIASDEDSGTNVRTDDEASAAFVVAKQILSNTLRLPYIRLHIVTWRPNKWLFINNSSSWINRYLDRVPKQSPHKFMNWIENRYTHASNYVLNDQGKLHDTERDHN